MGGGCSNQDPTIENAIKAKKEKEALKKRR